MSAALALAGALLAAYVLVVELDLGVGLLLPLVARGRDRDAILAGGGRPWSTGVALTLAAFALLVAGLPESLGALRALWPVLALMLLSLALRGTLAALRPYVLRQDLVDLAFGLASLAAVGCQGLALGWAVAGLGPNLPSRHAGPLGSVSVWGLLCAAGVVGLSALLGSGWLIASGRGAVRVFGREVACAAVLLVAGATVSCALWALWTGVVAAVAARGWEQASASGALGAAALALVVPSWLSLWGRRPAAPLVCAAVAAVCGLLAVVALPWHSPEAAGHGTGAAYLAFMLLIGSPIVVVDALRRPSAIGAEEAMPDETPSHAGRRVGSLANGLHLS